MITKSIHAAAKTSVPALMTPDSGIDFKALFDTQMSAVAGALPLDTAQPADPKLKNAKNALDIHGKNAKEKNDANPDPQAGVPLLPIAVDARTDIKAEAKADVKIDAKTDIKTGIKADAQTDVKIDAGADGKKGVGIGSNVQPADKGGASIKADISAKSDAKATTAGMDKTVLPANAEVKPDALSNAATPVKQPKSDLSAADIAASGNILPPREKTTEIKTDGMIQPIAPQQVYSTDAKQVQKDAIDSPVGTQNWNTELGQKVVWMSNEKQHVAELQLNPPNLGPMEVRLTVTDDKTSVQFTSIHPEVRDAIESALPKLKEMMMSSGISLGNTSVGAESFQQQSFSRQENRERGNFSPIEFPKINETVIRSGRMEGRVDTFA